MRLTLDGVNLTGAKTLLTMNGGSLTLIVCNTLSGLSDEKDNAEPTAAIAGAFELDGSGTLFIGAGVGNSCIKLAENAVFTQKVGIIRAQALKSPVALEAGMAAITGGKIMLYGHTGNSADSQREYGGLDAIKGDLEHSGGDFGQTRR